MTMVKKTGGLLIVMMLLSGCNLSARKAAVEIISYPSAKVYINDKEAGMTPYKNNTLKPGEVEIKLTTENNEWTKKLQLENATNTVINREFGKTERESGGYILYFEMTGDKNKAGFLASSQPVRSTVKIEDEVVGLSPIRIDNVEDGDKKLSISYPGYKNMNSFVKFIKGYQLVVEADLAKEEIVEMVETKAEETMIASGSAKKTVVVISQTETGWLRVRSSPSSGGSELTKINPGESYELMEEKDGWYRIDLKNGLSGWISAAYARKNSE